MQMDYPKSGLPMEVIVKKLKELKERGSTSKPRKDVKLSDSVFFAVSKWIRAIQLSRGDTLVSATDMFKAYSQWAKENDELEVDQMKFGTELTEIFSKKRTSIGIFYKVNKNPNGEEKDSEENKEKD